LVARERLAPRQEFILFSLGRTDIPLFFLLICTNLAEENWERKMEDKRATDT